MAKTHFLRRTSRTSLLLIVTFPLLSCGREGGGDRTPADPDPSRPVVAAVTISQPEILLEVDSTFDATAVVKDASGSVLTNRTITWSTADQSVASVDTNGVVTAIDRGVTNLTAACEGISDEVQVFTRYSQVDSTRVRAGTESSLQSGYGSALTVDGGVLPVGTVIQLSEIESSLDPNAPNQASDRVRLAVKYPTQGNLSIGEERASPGDETHFIYLTLSGASPPGEGVSRKVVTWVRNRWDAPMTYYSNGEMVTPTVDSQGRFVYETTLAYPAPLTDFDIEIGTMECTNEGSSSLYKVGATSGSVPDPDKIPLVLVHGRQAFNQQCDDFDDFRPDAPGDVWGDWTELFDSNGDETFQWLRDRFELWVFKYSSIQPIATSANQLAGLLETRLGGRDVALLAKGMGGVVAAQYMLSHPHRIRHLITLGSPLAGSPLANRHYEDFRDNEVYRNCLTGTGYVAEPIAFGAVVDDSYGFQDLSPESGPVQHVQTGMGLIQESLTTFAGDIDTNPRHDSTLDYDETQWAAQSMAGCVLEALGVEGHDGIVPVSSATTSNLSSKVFLGQGHHMMTRAPEILESVGNRLYELSHEIPTSPRLLHIESGDSQTGPPGMETPLPLSVRVVDELGVGVPGVAVTFTPDAGNGTTSPTMVETNEDGIAGTKWTLPAALGDYVVQVTAEGFGGSPLEGSPLLFHATAPEMTVVAYFPPRVGRTWTFALDDGTDIHTVSDQITGSTVIGETTWFRACGSGIYGGAFEDEECDLWSSSNGRVVQAPDEGTKHEVTVLKEPLVVGATWSIAHTGREWVVTIKEVGVQHTVEGRLYDDVIHLEAVPVDPSTALLSELFLARGVGIIEDIEKQYESETGSWEFLRRFTLIESNEGSHGSAPVSQAPLE